MNPSTDTYRLNEDGKGMGEEDDCKGRGEEGERREEDKIDQERSIV